MFLSVSAVCAEDSASLNLNETNINVETPVSTSTDVVADEQEISEYSNEDIVYASEITPGESSSNDINLSSYKVSYEKEITNGPVKAATAGTIYVNPTTGNDANTGTSWSTAVKTITGALSLVKDGGVICLANGEHTEAATITKNVALVGQNKDGTFLTKASSCFLKIENSVTVKVTGCSFTDNTGGPGCAIYVVAGNLIVDDCYFTSNNANAQTSAQGGAIYLGNGDLKVTNSVFTNNVAKNSGDAIYGHTGTININNCSFMNGKGLNSVYSRGTCQANIANSYFINNSASIVANLCNVTGCVFINNYNSSTYVAGISVTMNASIIVDNSVFINNSGYGISNTYNSENVIIDNNWWGSNSPDWGSSIHGLSAPKYVVLNIELNEIDVNIYEVIAKFCLNGTKAVVNIPTRDLEFKYGSESVKGKMSSVFSKQYSLNSGSNDVTVTVDNEIQNHALVGVLLDAVYVDPVNGDDENNGISWIKAFKSIERALSFVKNGGVMYLAEGSYAECPTIDSKNMTIIGQGTEKTILNNNMSSNRFFHILNCNVKFYNCSFIENYLDYGNGGAIYLENGNLIVVDCDFIGNFAGDTASGGAICLDNGDLTLVNCKFINNTAAEEAGGAVCVNNGTVSVDNCIFINNTALKHGGAIHVDNGILSLKNSVFVNNVAGTEKEQGTGDGGAVCIYGDLTVDNCSFDSNIGLNYGGAIYQMTGKLSVTNSYFVKNRAGLFDGGAIQSSADAEIINCSFVNNTAYWEGGALASSTGISCNWTLVNCSFIGNSAGNDGGAIYFIIGNINAYNCSFDKNTASNLGDAIYIRMANIIVNDCSLISNPETNNIIKIGDRCTYNLDSNWWGNNTPDWNSLINIQEGDNVSVPNYYVVLNVDVNEIDINMYEVTVKLYLNGTQTLANIPTRDVEFRSSSEVIKGKMVNGVFKYIYTLNIGDEKDISIVVDNEVQNITLVGHQLTTDMTIIADNITYGEDLEIIVVLSSFNITGKLTIYINDNPMEVDVVNGIAKIKLSGLNAGMYAIFVSFEGNEKYSPVSDYIMLEVYKADPVLNVIIKDINYGEIFDIDVVLTGVKSVGLDGNVTVVLNDKTYQVEVKNGRGTLSGVKLPVGSYEFSANWNGNDNYNSAQDSGKFNVNKVTPVMDVDVDDINVGEDVTVTVSVPVDATGDVVITVNGKDYTVAIKDGKAVQTISGLGAGSYDVTVKYVGDNNYNASSNSAKFSVSKVTPSMDVTVDNIVFGDDLTVNVVLPADATGTLTVTVDGVDYNVAIVNGKVTKAIPGLAAGNHTVIVKYNGDDKYVTAEIAKSINVAKANPVLNVVIADVDYNNVFTIEATLNGVNNAKLTGDIIVTVYGKDYVVSVVNGKGTLTADKLDAGYYAFSAKFAGNDNYNSVIDSGSFKVNKIASTMDISVDDINVGEDVTVTVSVPVDATGDVVITVNGKDYTVAIKDGKAVQTISGLGAGSYDVTVKYAGDNNYNTISNSTKFTVSKINPVMDVTADNIIFGGDLIISALLPSDINGDVIITVDGKEYTVNVVNGKVTKPISGLTAGNHTIVVKYNGNDKYNPVEVTKTINVAKADVNLDVIIDDVNYNTIFTINAVLTGVNNAKLSGDVIVTVNGKDYTVKVVDGKGTLQGIKLSAGSYDFTAKFAENDNYNLKQISGNFKVNKIASTVDISVDDIKVGEDATITVNVPSDATGSVTITVNGKDYTVAIVNGKVVQTISGLGAGSYDVTVKYVGDNNYNASSNSAKFSVSKVTPSMDVTVDNIVFGDDLTVNVVLPVDATGSVTVTVDGMDYNVAIVDGKATQSISGLNAGNHTVIVKYNGDDKYTVAEVAKSISVAKANPVLDVIIADVDYNNVFTIEATLNGVNNAKLTGDVIVTINGKDYVVSVVNGKGTLVADKLDAGSYAFSAKFAGNDNYTAEQISGNFKVNKIDSTIDVSVDDINVGEDVTITVSVPVDATGDIIITVNGEDYTVAIVNGKAIKTITNLGAGTYDVTVKYAGDNNYNNASNITKFTVSKINPVMDVTADNIIFGDDLIISALLPADINGEVIITVDGKEYTVNVVNGKVTKTISGLNAGDHTIVVKYNGNDKYNSVEVTKTVNVAKANPTLDVIINDVNYNTVFTINAVLTGVNNAKLTGDVIVTVNGKEYTVKVVDGKGTLEGIKLPVGSYEFSAKFAGNDNYNVEQISGNFKVNKIDSTIDVSVDDIKVGDDLTITVTVPVDATGDVIVTVNGENYTVAIKDGKAVQIISGLKEGVYDVTVRYGGDNNYNTASSADKFTVSKVTPTIDVSIDNIVFGDDLTVNMVLPADATGSVTVTVDGICYNVAIVDGKATQSISGLGAGNHTVIVKYNGDDKYTVAEVAKSISVAKANPVLDVVIADVDYNNVFTIEATLNGVNNAKLTGDVIVAINGKDYVVSVVDGKGTLEGIKLSAGSYDFSAKFADNDNYNSVSDSGNFKVNKIASTIDVFVDDINVGEDVTITVSVPVDATGDVVITVNGENYTVAIVDGKAIKTIANLGAGSYDVTVIYDGDNNYNNASNITKFTVSKINPVMDVTADNIIFGDDLIISALLPADINGEVIITVDGKEYTVNVVNGKVTKTISGLNAGDHTIVVKYNGNDKYNSVEVTKTVNVAKANPTLDVIINDVNYNTIFTINAVLTGANNAKLTGDVIVTVNGKDYTVKVVDGKGTLSGIKLSVGSYDFTAKFAGNDNYNSTAVSGSFKVNKIASTIDISVDDIQVGDDLTITVSVPVDATGDVIVTVNGKDYTVAIKDGKVVQTISGLKEGVYDVTVRYDGDNNYNNTSSTAKFTVSKVNPTIDVSVDDIIFGDDLTVNVVLPADATGSVTVTVDGVDYNVAIVDGKVTKSISGLGAGNHSVIVKYNGDDKYVTAEVAKSISVAKANPVLDVIIADVDYDSVFTIESTLNGVNSAKLTGDVIVTVNGKDYVVSVVDGKGTLEGIKLSAGSYDFSAKFAGNDNYNSVSDSGNFKVNKIASTIDISVDDINVGEDVTITVSVPVDATGDVIVTVNGEDYTVAIKDGKVVQPISGLGAGSYDVTVRYDGDNNYNNASSTAKFTVSKINPVMDVTADDIVFGDDLIISALLPSDINGEVIITVDGKEYTVDVVNGKVTKVISGLNAGDHTVVVKYNGNDKYNPVEVTKTINLAKADPILNVVIGDVNYNEIFVIGAVLTGANNAKLTGDVIVTVNGKDYTIKVVDGKGTLSGIKLPAGYYDFTASWVGNDNYNSVQDSGSFKVNKITPSIDISVDDILVGDDAVITVTVPSDATGDVIITVNGENYTVAIVDGKAVQTISGLKEGVYDVSVRYAGDNNYNNASNSAKFTVSEVNPVMDVTADDIVFGDDLTIDVVLPADATGDLIITVDGENYTVTLVDGKATKTIPGLNAGNHEIIVKYPGDNKYAPVEIAKTVNVAKANPVLDVVIVDVDYNNVFTIEATLTGVNSAKLSGDVIVTVNGKNYTVRVVDGKGTLSGIKLPAGTYDFSAKFNGNNNYNPATDSGNFKVNKIASTVDISVDDIKVGEDVVINVDLPYDSTGNVIVTVDGKDYTLAVVNGKANITISGLKEGNYTVDVKYLGDNNYNGITGADKFVVSKVNPVMDVIISDIVFGDDAVVNVNLPADINGTVIISVDDVEKTVVIINGKINEIISGLNAGTHTITVKYGGNDKYAPVEVTKTVNVAKANPVLDVVIVDVDYNNVFTIEATLTGVNSAKLSGDVIVTVNGKNYTVRVVDGKGTLSGIKLPAGTYDFTASWTGNDNYNETTVTGSFHVNKINSTIDVNVNDIKVDDDEIITVTVPSDATGEIIVVINGKNYTGTIVDGKAVIKVSGLKAGNYTANIIYLGDNNYNNISTTAKFSVSKINPVMDVIISDIVFGENITVIATLPGDINGTVIISVDGVNYTAAVVNGKINKVISGLNAGTHTVIVKYMGNYKYTPVEITKTVNVAKANPVLDVVIDNINYGEVFVIDATLTGVNGAKLTGDVIVTVNGKNYTVRIINGKGTLSGVQLPAGSYDFSAKFSGNSNYNAVSASGSFNVAKANSTLNVIIDDVKIDEDITIKATLTGINNAKLSGDVTVIINGKDYTVSVVNGEGKLTIAGLHNEGVYDFTATWKGDNNYMDASVAGKFNVSKVEEYPANITIPDGVEGKNSTISIDLPDDATGEIIVVIDGKNYTGNVSNGTGSVDIPPLDKGIHNITVIYPGDDKYDPVIKEGNITVDVNKDAILIVDNVLMIYHDGSKLTVLLKDFYGNPIANATVTITINGMSYSRVTDNDGYTFLTLNLNSGDYVATVVYQGNDYYNGAEVNASVKIIQSIIGENIVKMYQNGTQFFANFTDNKGNPLANTTVKFNINGVFYERKTNEHGTARLNINLRPGEYILTAYNPVTGEQEGFNITVKAPISENHDIIKYYKNGTQYTAKVYNKDGTLAVGKNVTFNINGVFYNRTVDKKGIVTLAINLNPGKYIITAIFDRYAVGNNVTVNTVLVTKDLSMKHGDGSKFNATVLDSQGKPLANQTVIFNINGVFYNRTTDSKGIASLNINLIAGEYIITSMWNDYQIGNKITIK